MALDDERNRTYKPNWPSRFYDALGRDGKVLWDALRGKRAVTARVFRTVGAFLRDYYVWIVVVIAGAVFTYLWLEIVQEFPEIVGKATAKILEALGNGDHEDVRSYAYAIAALLGAIAVFATLPFQLIRTWVIERQTRNAEQGHITERITKAVEQLGVEKTVILRERSVKYRCKEDGREQGPYVVTEIEGQKLSLPPDSSLIEEGEWKPHERTVPNIEVRLGAIYALERIAQDSERDHVTVMEILCAYIRQNAVTTDPVDPPLDAMPNWDDGDDSTGDGEPFHARMARFHQTIAEWRGTPIELRDDVRTALTVIERRSPARREHEARNRPAPFRISLSRATLQRLNLQGAKLENADLSATRLEGADLLGAHMQGADLYSAQMQGADLFGAQMQGAGLYKTQMQGAVLVKTQMQGANLRDAQMQGAHLDFVQMQGANLRDAQMQGADLVGADFKSADLSGLSLARCALRSTDFSGASNLQPEAIKSAFGVRAGIGRTILPTDLAISEADVEHWHVADDAAEDSFEAKAAFYLSYRRWLASLPAGKPSDNGP